MESRTKASPAQAAWVIPLVCLTLLTGRVHAESWTAVFGPESDTTCFLFRDGVIVRAPFSLETRDTLWRCPRGQRVVRFLASPRGGRVAWTSRGSNEDTTRLWIASHAGTEQRLGYFAMQPRRHGHEFAEPAAPTTADLAANGGRLILSRTRPDGPSANTLAWTSDGNGVLLGYDGGMARVVPGRSGVRRVSKYLPVKLEALPPSPMFVMDALVPRTASEQWQLSQFDLDHAVAVGLSTVEGQVVQPLQRRQVLARLGPDTLRECEAADWLRARVRAAGTTRIWWAEGRILKALRVSDCTPSLSIVTTDNVRWLAYSPDRGELLGVSGRCLWRLAEERETPEQVVEAGSEIKAVLRSGSGSSVAVVSRDSLLIWNPATGETCRLRSSGLEPDGFFEDPEGRYVVAVNGGPGQPVALARAVPSRGCLVPLEIPESPRWGVLSPSPHGRWIMLYEPGPAPPVRVDAYDVKSDCWRVVENPGISAWEPFAR